MCVLGGGGGERGALPGVGKMCVLVHEGGMTIPLPHEEVEAQRAGRAPGMIG